jgi:hypothetical protein
LCLTDRLLTAEGAIREEPMRRNVLTAGLVACAVVAICPGTLFGSAPSQAALRTAERPDLAPTVVRPWIREWTPDYLTVPLAPS